jgi:alpha-galactosidase
MQKTIVLIGAGSATFGFGAIGDILNSSVLEGSTIVLHDINAAMLRHVESVARQHIEARQLPYAVKATTSRKEALQGADFCVISIEVGNRFELWEQDWRIPQQYGCRQVYGENGGPGGLFHALRIIPPILDICNDIQAICPQAYVFNLSNPMSRICLTVKRKYPDLRFIGLCHESHSLKEDLPTILGVPFSDLTVRAGGLNHCSVLLEARYNDSGKDAYPQIRAKAGEYLATRPALADHLAEMLRGKGRHKAEFRGRRWADRYLIKEVFERFGYLPVTTDSHFGEYVQWAHDVADHEGILGFYHGYKEWCFQHSPERIGGTEGVERFSSIIEGILTGTGHEELAVNILNDGFIANLPRDLVVEVPATVDTNGVHGVQLGPLPKGIAGLLNNQVGALDLTAEAVLSGSKELVLQALLVDPVVDSVRGAAGMLNTMLKLQQDYLGYLR